MKKEKLTESIDYRFKMTASTLKQLTELLEGHVKNTDERFKAVAECLEILKNRINTVKAKGDVQIVVPKPKKSPKNVTGKNRKSVK